MIARLTVVDGTLTEYPIAEKVRGGWQNGVTFYPDEKVTKVVELRAVGVELWGPSVSDYREVFGREPEPWREPLGALRLTLAGDTLDVERARSELEALVKVLNGSGA